jgi:hypothetical protein
MARRPKIARQTVHVIGTFASAANASAGKLMVDADGRDAQHLEHGVLHQIPGGTEKVG